jgi:alkanesulfonate monooxygenase SsuD/methylene tetrahydromethanopterin reductase-like flavin-dependent oxidoreductase (luciferase family)
VTASTIAADTTDEAVWLAGPARLRRYGMRTGRMLPLLPPDEAAAHEEFERACEMPSSGLLGTAEEVAEGLDGLAERTEASELMLHTSTYGLPERIRSLELIAGVWPPQGTASDEPRAGEPMSPEAAERRADKPRAAERRADKEVAS